MKMRSRSHGIKAALVVAGLAIVGVGGVTLSDSNEVPRPFAPRADAIGPCADCDDQLLGFGLESSPQSVTEHMARGHWSPCPAGFRGAGRFGVSGRCDSDTTFRVRSERSTGLFRTPGLGPVAVCAVDEEETFDVVSERGAHRGPVGPNNPMLFRGTHNCSCSEIRTSQPELARQRFEVHQLSHVMRVLAETRDTTSGEVVTAEHEIGQIRFPVAVAVGVEAAFAE